MNGSEHIQRITQQLEALMHESFDPSFHVRVVHTHTEDWTRFVIDVIKLPRPGENPDGEIKWRA